MSKSLGFVVYNPKNLQSEMDTDRHMYSFCLDDEIPIVTLWAVKHLARGMHTWMFLHLPTTSSRDHCLAHKSWQAHNACLLSPLAFFRQKEVYGKGGGGIQHSRPTESNGITPFLATKQKLRWKKNNLEQIVCPCHIMEVWVEFINAVVGIFTLPDKKKN